MKIPERNIDFYNTFVYELKKLTNYNIGKCIEYLKKAKIWDSEYHLVSTSKTMLDYIDLNLEYNDTINYQTLSYEIININKHYTKIQRSYLNNTYRYILEIKKQIDDYTLKIAELEYNKTHSLNEIRNFDQTSNYRKYEVLLYGYEKLNEKITLLKKQKRRLENLLNPQEK